MEYQALQLDSGGPVVGIRLSRLTTGNRVDMRMLSELKDACGRIESSQDACVVIVTAEGEDFCSGWDETTRSELLAATSREPDPFGCLARLPLPVLASLKGRVIGAGLELSLACDIRIGAANSRFALPDVAAGSLPLAGGSQRLPRVVGPSLAGAMLLLGEEIDADAAYRSGLVSRVFAPERLDLETQALATRIAANGPIALRYAKELVHQGLEMPLDHALRYELDLSVILQTTRDRAEGVRAFLEKREPHFRGQ